MPHTLSLQPPARATVFQSTARARGEDNVRLTGDPAHPSGRQSSRMPDDGERPVPPTGPPASSGSPSGTYGAVPGAPATPPPAGGASGTANESASPGTEDGARDRGLSDLFRRAVAVGLEAAGRSKDDVVRIATNEIRGWLDHLELDTELRKALSKMVLEVKAEVRFRPTEDGGLAAQTESEMRIRPPNKTDR